MRLLPLLLVLAFSSAEYWTVHINARLKCNGRTVKDRLNYEVTDVNSTTFKPSRTVTKGKTRPQGWIQFTATKRHHWAPLLTIYHRCGMDTKAGCHKTVNITVPPDVLSSKFPKSFNLTGDDSYFSLDTPPSSAHAGTDCAPYFERRRRH